MKAIIELFDRAQIQNVIAGLRFQPEKIIFVGFKEMMTPKRIKDLEAFFRMRGMNIRLEYEIVGRYDFDVIVDKLNAIIDNNEDCCFDLTGGKELVLTAMGAVSAQRNISMVQFDVVAGKYIPVKNCENIVDTKKSSLLIKESVALNGGSVVNPGTKWEIGGEFRRDFELMWDICRKDCRAWNRQCNTFGGFEWVNRSKSELYVDVDLNEAELKDLDTFLDRRIISELMNAGLIYEYKSGANAVSFRYKNSQVYRCLVKAGNILEVYTYMTAKDINRDFPGYYDDISTGVVVDWDGEKTGIDTTNEIDIFLMRGLVPVFVSCKNGTVHKEALYELDIVAQKFGGKFAKKVLVSTYLNTDEESKKYLLQRARDMRIEVIEGVNNMEKAEFIESLRKAAK